MQGGPVASAARRVTMHHCPRCSSTFLRLVWPTRVGRLRLRFTARRPHECWHCGWRGWLVPEDPWAETPPDPLARSRAVPGASASPPADAAGEGQGGPSARGVPDEGARRPFRRARS